MLFVKTCIFNVVVLNPCPISALRTLRPPSEVKATFTKHHLSQQLHHPRLAHPQPPQADTMRWLQLLTASLLPFTALAAKKSSGDRFKDFRAKSLSTGAPVKLDDASYAQLTKAPRDYSVTVLLTALEQRFGCELCRQFQPEWDILGKSWTRGDKNADGRLLFGTLDFVDGKNTFQSVRGNDTLGKTAR